MGLINKETNVILEIQKRINTVDGGDYEARITETLLNEPAETPEEIAELETISDDNGIDTEKPELNIDLLDGPMKNIHLLKMGLNKDGKENK